jgi:hypothetical protein
MRHNHHTSSYVVNRVSVEEYEREGMDYTREQLIKAGLYEKHCESTYHIRVLKKILELSENIKNGIIWIVWSPIRFLLFSKTVKIALIVLLSILVGIFLTVTLLDNNVDNTSWLLNENRSSVNIEQQRQDKDVNDLLSQIPIEEENEIEDNPTLLEMIYTLRLIPSLRRRNKKRNVIKR